jgi:autotransporter-associated beta strand protein/T5SS/PEP-CTERM-associated repeat protein
MSLVNALRATLCISAVVAMRGESAVAQMVLTPGPSVSVNVTPFGGTADERYQQIYSSTLFTGAGVSGPVEIIGLRFSPSVNGVYSAGINLRLNQSATPVGGLSTSLDSNVTGALTTVLNNAAFSQSVIGGDSTYTLRFDFPTSPFLYDPTGGQNLLMDVEVSNKAGGFSFYRGGSTGVTSRATADFADGVGLRTLIEFRPAITTTTTYTSVWSGGTIAPGNTVVLNDGASVSGNVTNNGTLQFNQSEVLTITSTISGTGTLSLTSTGTLNLAGLNELNTIALDLTTNVSSGGLQALSGNAELRIGSSGVGVLNLNGGTVTNSHGWIGAQNGGSGTATVRSGTWANSGNLTVGVSGTGTLTMTGGLVTVGGTLSKGTHGTINLSPGGMLQIGTGGTTGSLDTNLANSGTLIFDRADDSTYSGVISGSGAIVKQGGGTLTLTGTLAAEYAVVVNQPLSVSSGTLAVLQGGTGRLWVGSGSSAGTLAVTGGRVVNNDGWLGAEVSGHGTALVTSGTWANRRYLDVGASGTGVLTLQGGVVSSSSSVIGWNPGSVGTLTIQGGTFAASGDVAVAERGSGTMLLQGGAVENYRTRIGYRATGQGRAIVEGGEWTNRDFFYVGVVGDGRFDMKGGVVRNTYSIAGYDPGGTGTVDVTGGRWLSSDFLVVGRKGVGSMTIQGGYVENVNGILGYYLEGAGSALVTGGTWANRGNLAVGLSGTGTLSLSGGLVTVGGTLSKGAYGTINLNAGGTLQVGTGGTTGVMVTDLTNNGTLNFNRSGSSTYSGVISGVGSLVKQGPGTLRLTGVSTHTGGTRIEAGIVYAEASSAMGSGPILITGSAQRLVVGDGAVITNDIIIDRPVGQAGYGVLHFEGQGMARLTTGTIRIQENIPRGGEFGVTGSGTLCVESPIVASGSSVVVMRIGTAIFSGGGEYGEFRIGEGTVRLGRDHGISRSAVARIGWVQHPSSAWLDLAGYDQSVVGVERGLPTGTIGNSSTARNSTLTLTGSSTFSGVIQDRLDGGTKQMCLAVDGGWLGLTNANTLSGSTTVRNGTIQLGHANALHASTVSIFSGGTLSLTSRLATTVGGLKLGADGLVDVGNGMLTVTNGLSSFKLFASLSMGRGNGSWDGVSGITSGSAAASRGTRTVGWLDHGDGSVTFGYAAAGDTNLDWRVDDLDLANILSSGQFNSELTATWLEGDFNYDGFVDILDMADLIAVDLFNGGSYNRPATGSIAAVPEPATLWMIGVGLAGFLAMGGRLRSRSNQGRVSGFFGRADPAGGFRCQTSPSGCSIHQTGW